ncbi:hypothetical protein [Nocardia sp. alder85J]|uniref:hypothetical protein n=1 Tax=Nocardia sp. alder85J TaxID=2862949 RepID=UPI001CD26CE7|nr:hypothetical protein [Nocardia sp. alder85J]MCX4091625.1 hypothetical protein [Nocardia sp. alder85J]
MPITVAPNGVFKGRLPGVQQGGNQAAPTATVVVQPGGGTATPNFLVELRFGTPRPSTNLKDLHQREVTGKTVILVDWYNTTVWSYPPQFGMAGVWNGTRVFDLGGTDPGDHFEIENKGTTDIQVTVA